MNCRTHPDIKELSILVVDDQHENLLAIQKTLEVLPARLLLAQSGEEALALTLEHSFVLAILDVQMPTIDGFELAELLRRDPSTSRLPIIFITAMHLNQEHQDKGYNIGAVDYIITPFDPSHLLSKVRGFIELGRYLQTLEYDHTELLETLSRRNQDLTNLCQTLSHNLMSSMRKIQSLSNIAGELSEPEGDSELIFLLKRIEHITTQGQDVLGGLVHLFSIREDMMKIHRCNISALARSVVHNMDKQLLLEAPHEYYVLGDSDLLRALLLNVFDNSARYSEVARACHVQLTCHQENGRVLVEIKDDGPGVSQEQLSRLFKLRLNALSSKTRFGLGLTEVQRIVQAHGGTVSAESAEGEGLTIRFDLHTASQSEDS